jgi:hypothetical protein
MFSWVQAWAKKKNSWPEKPCLTLSTKLHQICSTPAPLVVCPSPLWKKKAELLASGRQIEDGTWLMLIPFPARLHSALVPARPTRASVSRAHIGPITCTTCSCKDRSRPLTLPKHISCPTPRSTFEISRCNTCNICLKIDETLETCFCNTCKKHLKKAWKPLQTYATSK